MDLNDYPGGRLIYPRPPFEGDLLFREGINVPELSPSILLAVGATLTNRDPGVDIEGQHAQMS